MTDTAFTTDFELDLDGEGLQPFDGEFEITNVSVEENDAGRRWVVEFEPADGVEVDGLLGNKVRDSGYMTHADREELVKIGMGNLKRLGQAVLGTTKFRLDDLIGERVKARVSEDSSGFARIGRYKSVSR